MMTTTTRATELVRLWIFNDEVLLDDCLAVTRQDYDLNIYRDQALKERIESMAEAIAPQVYEASFVADLFQYALADVEWNKLTDDLIDYDREN